MGVLAVLLVSDGGYITQIAHELIPAVVETVRTGQAEVCVWVRSHWLSGKLNGQIDQQARMSISPENRGDRQPDDPSDYNYSQPVLIN